ncbi:MAG TPA: UDP-3-O-acyl-N-acetylglucosamine deacetylase [Chlamydiales bacterium]|nr:UDP-3-O-acyl-N-acetylglucosamine deacetylase [Chlamydiales bacterium]
MCLSQKTIQKEVEISGIGLFTGKKAHLRLVPGKVGTGIIFCRKDLPHQPLISAIVSNVRKTPRCTTLHENGEGATITMVEHLLSALKAYGIDNLRIELDGPEIPVGDGSAKVFVELIEKSGILLQPEEKKVYSLDRPIHFSEGDTHLVALPSNEFKISYTLHYPHSTFLKSQYYSLSLNEGSFKEAISTCRTFSLYEEIAPLLEKGLLKNVGLENGVVIKGDGVMNPEGLRFPDEMVRHKILDLIGDLSLVGCPFYAHILSIRSGHSSNVSFASLLRDHFLKK